jgi:rare lipoprotein A
MRPGRLARGWLPLLAAVALLAGCAGREPPASPRYFLGEPYRMGGVWSYPREDFGLRETGVAEILASPRPPRLTAAGEVFRDGELLGAHRGLQLPAILWVTNLETGRSLRLRLIERGPETPGRVLGVSARAAELLGASGPFQARIEIDPEASRAAISGLPGQAEPLRIATAPVGRVEREPLDRAPGAGRPPAGVARVVEVVPIPGFTGPLPEEVIQGRPEPGRLMLEASSFFRRDLAQRQAARIPGGRAEPGRERQSWRVVAGPYGSLAEADAALAAARGAGLSELRLVVR